MTIQIITRRSSYFNINITDWATTTCLRLLTGKIQNLMENTTLGKNTATGEIIQPRVEGVIKIMTGEWISHMSTTHLKMFHFLFWSVFLPLQHHVLPCGWHSFHPTSEQWPKALLQILQDLVREEAVRWSSVCNGWASVITFMNHEPYWADVGADWPDGMKNMLIVPNSWEMLQEVRCDYLNKLTARMPGLRL